MHASKQQLEATLTHIQAAPAAAGPVELIVCRPANNQRKVLTEAQLDPETGLQGDNWSQRGNPAAKDQSAYRDMQINIMGARAAAVIAQDKSRWPLAGDQFFIDLDLSEDNLPPGTRLAVGTAILEITAEPHLGCRKFSDHFGKDAVMFVNSDIGKALHLRGLNAKIVQGGVVVTGDMARKL